MGEIHPFVWVAIALAIMGMVLPIQRFPAPNFDQGIQNSCTSTSLVFVTTGVITGITTKRSGYIEYDFGIGATSLTSITVITLGIYAVEDVPQPFPSTTCGAALPAGSFSVDGTGDSATPPSPGGYTWIGHQQIVNLGVGHVLWIFVVMKTTNILDAVNVNGGILVTKEL